MTKQVIVIRKDLNMRKGKMVAQGAHASLKAYIAASFDHGKTGNFIAAEWMLTLGTKICVSVDSEAELKEIFDKADAAKLPVVIIKDAGLTEFKEPTLTACAIGPASAEEIDKITGHLKLL